METSEAAPAAEVAPPESPSLNVFERSVAVFTRPASAWGGLERHSQWWFPLTVLIVFSSVFTLLLYDRAIVPMVTGRWEQAAENGSLPQERLDKMEDFMRSPAGMAMTIGQQAVGLAIVYLVLALGVWFGAGFVLGTKLRYRLALEIATWSGLIGIPAQILTGVLAWIKGTMQGVHVGWGILVPEADPPTKLLTALATFLDSLGPFAIWSVIVVILGAAALSGAPRRSAAWVIGGLYLALAVLMAAMAGLFTPAG